VTNLPITAPFVATFAVALVALSVPISLRRAKVGVMVGQSDDETLRHRIRAQANFTEYVPLGLIALVLVEAQGAASWIVVTIGGTLALGRVFHAGGMLGPSDVMRGLGMLCTYLSLIGAAFVLVT
jgi:uncharacterized protein